jgi:uncharacterized protein (DUF885 family)
MLTAIPRIGEFGGTTMSEAAPQAGELAERYWEDLLELEPMLGTEVGDERYDDRLPDPSEEGLAHRADVQRRALAELEGIDRSALDVTARTTLDVMEAIAQRDLDSVEYRFDRFTAVVHIWGPAQLLAELASRQRADTDERRERYLRRLQAVPGYLDEMCRIIREAATLGQTVPEVVADRTIGQVERLVAGDPADSPVLTPLAGVADDQRQPYVDLVSSAIMPAYERYLGALRDYRPHATATLGLSALDHGEEMYAAQIRAWT